MFRPIMTSNKPTWPLGCKENPEKQCGRCDKSTKFMLHTWFTWQIALRDSKVPGPRGGARLEQFARYVYYKDGRFWRAKTHKRPDRTSTRDEYASYEPVNGVIWTVFPRYQARHNLPDASILCRDGYPSVLVMDEGEFQVDADTWPMMEGFLGLDQSYKRVRRAS